MAADLKAAAAFVPALGEALDRVPAYSTSLGARAIEPQRKAAIAELRQMIERAGGKTEESWQGAAIRLYGLRATSTSSLTNACLNWIAQVSRKSQAAQNPAGAA